MAKVSKSPIDSKRNTLVHSLAFRWLELNRPDVVQLCREEGIKKYPKSGPSRTKVELTSALAKLK